MTMHGTLQRLFGYKAWADDELLTALARLGDESPVTRLAIRAFSHSHVVDRIFLSHLRGKEPPFRSTNLIELPTLERLSADIRASDQDYLDHLRELQPDRLVEDIDFLFTDGVPGRMSREEILLHVITHGVGHRGQISAVMLLHSAPPARDGFTTYLHMAEAGTRRPTHA